MARDERSWMDPGGRARRDERVRTVSNRMEQEKTNGRSRPGYHPIRMDKKTDRMNDLYERGSI